MTESPIDSAYGHRQRNVNPRNAWVREYFKNAGPHASLNPTRLVSTLPIATLIACENSLTTDFKLMYSAPIIRCARTRRRTHCRSRTYDEFKSSSLTAHSLPSGGSASTRGLYGQEYYKGKAHPTRNYWADAPLPKPKRSGMSPPTPKHSRHGAADRGHMGRLC